jgi:enediyne biosynthesis thioesterase
MTLTVRDRSSANAAAIPGFVYLHVVTFEETNLVGNVYYTNYIRWQGHCRELFLMERAPEVLRQLQDRQLVLHTSSVGCEFFSERGLSAGDHVRVLMRLSELRGGRLGLTFDYERLPAWPAHDGAELVARGTQQLCSKHWGSDGSLVACVLPVPLLQALVPFASDEIRERIADAVEFQSPVVTR